MPADAGNLGTHKMQLPVWDTQLVALQAGHETSWGKDGTIKCTCGNAMEE
jgi:hypothetical protein